VALSASTLRAEIGFAKLADEISITASCDIEIQMFGGLADQFENSQSEPILDIHRVVRRLEFFDCASLSLLADRPVNLSRPSA
jgi:hypothetical protein